MPAGFRKVRRWFWLNQQEKLHFQILADKEIGSLQPQPTLISDRDVNHS